MAPAFVWEPRPTKDALSSCWTKKPATVYSGGRFQRPLKLGMGILRTPPGHQDDEAPPPPRNPLIRIVFAVLFLVIGMVVFFIGGLVVHLEEASFARSSPELAQLFRKQIIPGITKLRPAGRVTEIRDAIGKCRVKANTTIQFYHELP